MKLTDADLKRLYQQETARASDARADCLPSEVLARAAAGELGGDERGQVADHLAGCAECAAEYRLARSASAVNASEPSPSARERDRGWWAGLFARGWRLAPAALAAALLVTSLGLGAWVARLRRELRRPVARETSEIAALNAALEEARRGAAESARRAEQNEAQIAELRRELDEISQPQPNPPIIDLDPRDAARGEAAGAIMTVTVPPGANFFTLVLNLPGPPEYETYAVELSDQRGAVVLSREGLRPNEFNACTLGLARRAVPAGQYRVKLFGLRGGRRALQAEYRVRVRYAGAK